MIFFVHPSKTSHGHQQKSINKTPSIKPKTIFGFKVNISKIHIPITTHLYNPKTHPFLWQMVFHLLMLFPKGKYATVSTTYTDPSPHLAAPGACPSSCNRNGPHEPSFWLAPISASLPTRPTQPPPPPPEEIQKKVESETLIIR